MYLKYLEIQGFKSFADKLKITFEGGVTAIVGPNGCGKSNVVDALRWVLCETNPRRIRCLKERDVIFHGSASRPQVGFAQVNLLLDNSSGWLNIDVAEVLITRKLYANGESGYYINREAVRMKDIKELLMNTGLVSNIYSTLELAEVRSILESSPEQIRFLFDAAAGVTKYRVHRDEAQRRISRTQDDLNRVTDIISELESEIKVLDSQARKAKRFEKLKVKLDAAIAGNILLDFGEHFEKKKNLEKELASAGDRLTENSSSLDKLNAAVEKKQLELDEIESKLSGARAAASETLAQTKVIEERISYTQSQLAEIPVGIERLSSRKKKLEKELAELKPVYEKLSGAKDEMEKNYEEIKSAIASERSAFEEKLRETKNSLFDTLSEITSAENGIKNSAEEIQKTQTGLSALGGEIPEAEAALEAMNKEKARFAEEAEELEKKIKELVSKAQESEKESSRLAGGVAELTGKLNAARIELARLETDLGFSIGRKKEYESLEKKLKDGGVWVGNLESGVEVPPQLEDSLRALISNFPKVVFLKDMKAVKKYAASGDLPPVLLVSAEDLMKYGTPATAAPSGTIRGKNEYAEKFLNVLASFFPEGGLSANGELNLPFGILASGVSSTADIPKIEEEIANRKKFIEDAEKSIEADNGRIKELAEESSGISSEISSMKSKLIQNAAAVKNIEARSEDKNAALDEKKAEAARLEEHLSGLKEVSSQKRGSLEGLRAKAAIQQERLSSIEKTIASAEETKQHITRAEQEAGLQRYEKFRVEYEKATSDNARLTEEIESLSREIAQASGEIKYLEERKSEMESELKAHKEKGGSSNAFIGELKKSHDSLRSGLDALRKQTSSAGSEVYESKKHVEIVSADIRHSAELLEGLEHRLNEEFGLTIDEGLKKYENPQRFSEEEIGKMKARVEEIGSVNLLAPEDYERVTKRRDFLDTQSSDLRKAIDDINKIIDEANTKIKENFLKTFEAARENFKNVYSIFFEGGNAELLLTDPENAVESGVEVKAAPPGKKINSNTQLSTGENALTAIALLFALFMIKPSPFCIVDEVDAPLDDANVVRFNKLLRQFSKNTQFAAITHNKRTMEMADVIYGITMEEFGVSKLVSVKFRKIIGEE